MHPMRSGADGPRWTSGPGLGIVAMLTLWPAGASALEYHVDTTAANEVKFISDAPIEDFEGVTSRIDGYAFWKDDSLAVGASFKQSEVYFEVPLASLSTGIDLRDRHMRENYLHTERHPFVSYKGEIQSLSLGRGDTLLVGTKGQLSLHGHTKDYEIVCSVVGARPAYAVAAQFDIKLGDFEIEIPSLMFMKINEVIQLQVRVHVAEKK